jgi:hypothetical protein
MGTAPYLGRTSQKQWENDAEDIDSSDGSTPSALHNTAGQLSHGYVSGRKIVAVPIKTFWTNTNMELLILTDSSRGV